MPLCMMVGLGPGNIVFDADQAPSPKGQISANFWPMSVVAKWLMALDATWYEGRPQPRPHCVTWGSSFSP